MGPAEVGRGRRVERRQRGRGARDRRPWPPPGAPGSEPPPSVRRRRALRSSETVRANRATVERTGLAIIAFIVAWLAIGLEIALLGAALVVGFELIRDRIALADDADGETTADRGRAAIRR